MPGTLSLVAAFFGFLGFVLLLLTGRALKRRRLRRTVTHGFFALLWFTLAALFATLSVATQGYRALTREEVVARVSTRQLAPQSFEARVEFPDGRHFTHELAGDELYIDAHILKWKPIVNVLGLHTEYELDRIGGRYRALEDEQGKTRTLFSLAEEKPLDLFELRHTYTWLSPLVDAEYGSGTFISTEDGGRFEVLVSTSGLLVRRLPEGGRAP